LFRLVALFTLLPACFAAAQRLNQPSAEQQAQADASRQRYCEQAASIMWDTYCDHPPKKIIPDYVDGAKGSRNNLARECVNNPAPLHRLDSCISELEARE
jgi:hypothetical protein